VGTTRVRSRPGSSSPVLCGPGSGRRGRPAVPLVLEVRSSGRVDPTARRAFLEAFAEAILDAAERKVMHKGLDSGAVPG